MVWRSKSVLGGGPTSTTVVVLSFLNKIIYFFQLSLFEHLPGA